MSYFGGKSRIAKQIWERLDGKTLDCYIEPCMGSAATYLMRPQPIVGREILNDYDSLLVNAWRSMQRVPDKVAEICYGLLRAESELHAVHAYLTEQRDVMRPRIEGNPDLYDPRLGAWWLWGICMKLGGGWCSGEGPWHVIDDRLVCLDSNDPRRGNGITRSVPCVGNRGVLRQSIDDLKAWMRALSNRLQNALILNGDWSRAVTPAMTGAGIIGIMFDPPYGAEAGYDSTLYTNQDADISTKIKTWCINHTNAAWLRENKDRNTYRIAYCGYSSGVANAGNEGDALERVGWKKVYWTNLGVKAGGGYGNQGQANAAVVVEGQVHRGNASRECVWFSPRCNYDRRLIGD